MRHLINRLTGGDMWVADDREQEYLEAGHKPASVTVKPAKAAEPEKKPEEPKPAKSKLITKRKK